MLCAIVAFCLFQLAQPSESVKDFIEWRSKQPAQTSIFELYRQYREALKQNGFSEAQIQAVFRNLETDRWNRAFSNPVPMFNTAPNAFMTEMVKGLKPGRALEIGMGQGRNSVYLAKTGWDVTGFDISEVGMKVAEKSAAAAGVKIQTIKSAMEDSIMVRINGI